MKSMVFVNSPKMFLTYTNCQSYLYDILFILLIIIWKLDNLIGYLGEVKCERWRTIGIDDICSYTF